MNTTQSKSAQNSEQTITQAQTEQTAQNVIDIQPVFTEEQIDKIEGEYNTTWCVNRRMMLMVLSKSGESLVDILESTLSEDDPAETYFDLIEQITDYEEHLKTGIELAKAATARLLLVAQLAVDTEELQSKVCGGMQ